MRNTGHRGSPVSFGKQQKRHGSALRGLCVDLAVPDVDLRPCAQSLKGRMQRGRIGFAQGQTVAAQNHFKKTGEVKMVENGAGGGNRFVGTYPEAMPRPYKGGKRRPDAFVWFGQFIRMVWSIQPPAHTGEERPREAAFVLHLQCRVRHASF